MRQWRSHYPLGTLTQKMAEGVPVRPPCICTVLETVQTRVLNARLLRHL